MVGLCPFVTADPIDAQQPVERAQQGTFVSSRHALKAARLLAHVMAAPQPLPANLLGQFVELMPDIAAALQVTCCEDESGIALGLWQVDVLCVDGLAATGVGLAWALWLLLQGVKVGPPSACFSCRRARTPRQWRCYRAGWQP